jgi:hypothetical protein
MSERRIPPDLRARIAAQEGLLTRQQLSHAGLPDDLVGSNVKAGRWQRVLPRVYATVTGPLTRPAQIWAGILYAGAGATVSYETAAEAWGLVDEPGPGVHLTIGVDRRVRGLGGIRIHYSSRLDAARHPIRIPPVTTVEETVLDLVDQAERVGDIELWVTRACQRRRTTPERLGIALAARRRFRWRREMQQLLVDVSTGAESPLRDRLRPEGRARPWPASGPPAAPPSVRSAESMERRGVRRLSYRRGARRTDRPFR